MSQNKSSSGQGELQGIGAGATESTSKQSGASTTGKTDAGTTRNTSSGLTYGGAVTGNAGTADASLAQGQEYGQRIAEVAQTAKDYVSDRVSVVGDKITELRNKDYAEIADDARDYARQNLGQSMLLAAAAGLIIGYFLRPPGDPTTPPPPPRRRP